MKHSRVQDARACEQKEGPYKYLLPIKEIHNDNGFFRFKYHMKTIPDQDGMAWETQGLTADRTREHLGSSDKGLVVFRQMLRLQIEAVRKGQDPLGGRSGSEKKQHH